MAKQKPKTPVGPAQVQQPAPPPEVGTVTSATVYENHKEVIDEQLALMVKHLNGLDLLVALEIISMLPDYYDEHGVTRGEKNKKRRKPNTKPKKPAGSNPLGW